MTFHGKASVYGIAGGDLVYTGPAAAAWASGVDQVVTQGKLKNSGNIRWMRNGSGERIGLSVNDKERGITLTYWPTGTTLDDAKEACELPDFPAKVALSGFPESAAGNRIAINGDWLYLGDGDLDMSEEQWKITLPLIQITSNGLTADQLLASIS